MRNIIFIQTSIEAKSSFVVLVRVDNSISYVFPLQIPKTQIEIEASLGLLNKLKALQSSVALVATKQITVENFSSIDVLKRFLADQSMSTAGESKESSLELYEVDLLHVSPNKLFRSIYFRSFFNDTNLLNENAKILKQIKNCFYANSPNKSDALKNSGHCKTKDYLRSDGNFISEVTKGFVHQKKIAHTKRTGNMLWIKSLPLFSEFAISAFFVLLINFIPWNQLFGFSRQKDWTLSTQNSNFASLAALIKFVQDHAFASLQVFSLLVIVSYKFVFKLLLEFLISSLCFLKWFAAKLGVFYKFLWRKMRDFFLLINNRYYSPEIKVT